LNDDGTVNLFGRSTDVVNVGGVKINLVDVDHELMGLLGTEDVATFDYFDAAGAPRIGVALVAGDDYDRARFLEVFAASTRGLQPSRIIHVLGIPRNQMDKPLRRELAKLVEEGDS